MEIDSHAQEALNLMNDTHEHIFLTGNAGTGKSTLLRHFLRQTEKSLAVLAPTGVSALHIGGQTIHSFFHFPITVTLESVPKLAIRYVRDEVYTELETLVIDEISMVRADIMDCIDQFLRLTRQNFMPFGGVQMIMVGDLHQLPPIVSRAERSFFKQIYKSPFFFAAHVWGEDQANLHICELQKVHRQADPLLIRCLNDIRTHQHTQRHLSWLNQRVKKGYILQEGEMYITTRNAKVAEINQKMLDGLDTKSVRCTANISGRMPTGTYPTDEDLELKIGAQVMFVKNDADGRFANGTIGKILEIREATIDRSKVSQYDTADAVSPPQLSASFLPKGGHYDEDGFWVGEGEGVYSSEESVQLDIGKKDVHPFDDDDDFIQDEPDTYTGMTVIVEDIYGLQIEVSATKRELKEYVYSDEHKKLISETIGSFMQIPLRLARATTIHKAQGKTFDRVVVDFSGGMFASGQAYVALSRCTSLEGMTLTTPIYMKDIQTDMEVVRWMSEKKENI